MARTLSEWQVPTNVGPLDRAIRIVLGLALLALVFAGPESLWGLVGFVPLLTGLAGYCPLYAMLDFSTVGTPHRVKHA
jgi:hypothetical protein